MTDAALQDVARRFILYFDSAVLASYRQNSHRFDVTTDNFEGTVRVRSDFFESLPDDQRNEYLELTPQNRTTSRRL